MPLVSVIGMSSCEQFLLFRLAVLLAPVLLAICQVAAALKWVQPAIRFCQGLESGGAALHHLPVDPFSFHVARPQHSYILASCGILAVLFGGL